MKLLIVESPAKATTINRYLGPDFKVLASYGHVRDLPSKDGAVDPENDFAMIYELNEGSERHVRAIVAAAKKAEAVYLATDLDREGEAISWHIYEILREKGLAEKIPFYRIAFSEITKRAIREAVDHPRELSMDLVNAQQARRALDHLVGFNLSPLLWKKIKTGLSAGRVQSPALRMLVEREREIEAFDAQEYWTIEADLKHKEQGFDSRLVRLGNERLKQFDINNEKQAQEVRRRLLDDAGGKLKVGEVKRSQRKRRPAPPFITSTLQQDAARKLRFSAQKTMRTAQGLYEAGFITYMRTDSVHLSADALSDIRGCIKGRFGDEFVPEKPNFYKTKSKNAQEAHEAIRPTSACDAPDTLKKRLQGDQARLYELIWKRAVASQMVPALVDMVAVEFACGEGASFRSNGSVIAFPGFLRAYEESRPAGKEEKENRLPDMREGDVVSVEEIRAEQHFTEPPPRFSEASLVKALEDYGIGRPSTYASIIQTLVRRNYVELDRRRFFPTETGRVVASFLEKHFEPYVDYEFTARMEDTLDEISRGEMHWIPPLMQFWKPFAKRIEDKEESVSRQEARATRVLGNDPKTGKEVSVRLGRFGPHAQIGSVEDDEKPKFAGLRNGQRLETITLEEALELFKLPRTLGETEEGETVAAGIGRFGPYIRYGSKFVSLKDDDPHTVTLDTALELIAAKKQADLDRILRTWDDSDVQIVKGRWGPFITDGNKNARMPKDREPDSMTLEECQELLDAAPDKRSKKKASKKKTAKKKTSKKKTSKKKTSKKKTARKKASKKKAGSG
ncbi:MAG: type I DNA topoisomerase [Xanthomonadales bacterium]|nr:type I DNA topoisomerase [Gammaproteobacteria bacterium]MBT8050663.1 type I DNA topoisomerase [Gammaproteobacteria bacterium]MBT8056251.1 type I DNA topoisomerase [Gammaproteobacteria bacterium]NNJ77885.1 type I DNA topoisomerase [Xanthomonadales bacterium]NNL04108.1 type I DNA topoisomerase [Xanthomonadales bacterium]